jgi:hypothetical protein
MFCFDNCQSSRNYKQRTMASSLVPSSEESNELVILVMNTDFATHVQSRDEEIASFIKQLNPKPDFLLLQEVKIKKHQNRRESIDQISDISESLGHYRATDGTRKSYSLFWGEGSLHIPKNEGFERIESYNMIMCKGEHQGTQFQLEAKRYCVGQFTFKGKEILLVSFHGNSKLDATDIKLKNNSRFSQIAETEIIKAIKQFRLGKYLNLFHKLKVDNKCDHLIIGGDLNLNVDKLLVPDEIKAKTPTPGQLLLRQRQEDFIQLFDSLGLQIVPYNHQRNGRRKIDALICDKDLSNNIGVTVFSSGKYIPGGDTLVNNSLFSQNCLDHDPLLFNIRIRDLTTGAQNLDYLGERMSRMNVNN